MAMWKLCKVFSVVIAGLFIICLLRTFALLNLSQSKLEKCSKDEKRGYIHLTNETWNRFRDSLRMKTVSYAVGVQEVEELERLVNHIIKSHPSIFESQNVEYEVVANYSLLIHVRGSNKNLLPYLLASHLDVVPAHEEEWSVNPFDAFEDENKTFVINRGALDCKSTFMAHLAALEFYLKRGIIPERSFYLAYGNDEEVGGHGASEIAKVLRKNGVNKLHFILDEGLFVLRDVVPGVNQDLALIAVSEKGEMYVNMSVELQGGHSSIPRSETAVGILAEAVSRLQSQQMPPIIDDITNEMLQLLTPACPFPLNLLTANTWLFSPLLARFFASQDLLKGVVRTTTAVTVIKGGAKQNVIPASASAIVNYRIHPTDSIKTVLMHSKSVVNDDRVNMTSIYYTPPHSISPYDRATSLPYQVLVDTIDQMFETGAVLPATFVANTDTKHYISFTENIYRFSPFILTQSDVKRIHGKDEMISKKNFETMINFYYHLILNSDRIKLRELFYTQNEL